MSSGNNKLKQTIQPSVWLESKSLHSQNCSLVFSACANSFKVFKKENMMVHCGTTISPECKYSLGHYTLRGILRIQNLRNIQMTKTPKFIPGKRRMIYHHFNQLPYAGDTEPSPCGFRGQEICVLMHVLMLQGGRFLLNARISKQLDLLKSRTGYFTR